MKRYSKRLWMVLGMLCYVVGCTDAEDSSAAFDANKTADDDVVAAYGVEPLLRIDAGQSRTVEIYEPEPGLFMIGSTGPIGTAPVTEDYDLSGTITEVYRALVPGGALPQKLIDAQTRQDLAPVTTIKMPDEQNTVEASPVELEGGHEVVAADTAAEIVQKDYWSDYWQEYICDPNLMHFSWYPIRENCMVFRMNGGSWNENARTEAYPGCSAIDGNINCRLKWKPLGSGSSSYQTLWDVSVTEGYYNRILYHANPLGSEVDWRFEIYNAADNIYHRMFMVSWNQCASGCYPSASDVCLCPV